MKIYIIALLISVNYIFCSTTESSCEDVNPASKSDCTNFYNGIESDGYHCCYSRETYNGVDTYQCFDLNRDEYNKIKETIKDIENSFYNLGYELKIKSLDCNSYYLQLGLISLIFLLF